MVDNSVILTCCFIITYYDKFYVHGLKSILSWEKRVIQWDTLWIWRFTAKLAYLVLLKFWTNSIIPYANAGVVPYIHVLLAVCSIRKAPLRSHLHLRLMDLAEEPCSTKGYKMILRQEDVRHHRSRGPAIRTSKAVSEHGMAKFMDTVEGTSTMDRSLVLPNTLAQNRT